MREQRVGTIYLSGEEALSFANSLFRPTKEAVEVHDARMSRIEDSVVIHQNENGFSAEISDLDLSFMDQGVGEESLEFQVTMKIRCSGIFFSSMMNPIAQTIVCVKEQTEYCGLLSDGSMSVAA